MTNYWISITGLELKSIFRKPQFLMHAIPSFAQAQASPGNVSTDARTVDGIEHTLTVWESRKDMLAYLRQGAHLKAMQAKKSMGKYGKVHGYESDQIPSWPQALEIWKDQGRVVLGEPKAEDLAAAAVVAKDESTSCPAKATISVSS
jgi:hypothetical protein